MSDWGSRAWQMVKETRFVAHDPEQLWAMVEPADGATATGLGELLTQAAKTIKDIGSDLRTHSLAVEWDGEGGEAFRTWCNQAALATLGLGDYSESAGKWLGHAADTLHEVKPQLEILRKQSATARSVLDAHAAKATDVGNHDGGPSDTKVKTAKTQYANDSADAAGLMIKLAQSYTASTEQIDALEAPDFPKLPEQFVPQSIDRRSVSVPTDSGSSGGEAVARAASPARESSIDSGSSVTGSATQASPPRHLAGKPDVPVTVQGLPADTTNTAIDSVGTLPSAPSAPSSAPAPASGIGGPDSRVSSPTGLLPPVFGGGSMPPPGIGTGGGRSTYGGRGSLPTGPGASESPRAGRGLPTTPGSGMAGTGSPRTPGRGLAGPSASRDINGITGGRPISPVAGRPTGAIPRGTVIGGTPNQQQTSVGRGAVTGGTSPGATPTRSGERTTTREGAARGSRPPAQSGGIVGGQPRPSQQRGRAAFTSGGEGLVRGTNANGTPPQSDGTARGAFAPPPRQGDRSRRGDRSRNDSSHPAEDGDNPRSNPPQPD
ncbi:hypothetical protein ACIA7S_16830 [Streptomyces sp. NPDC051643]|uniref:hypothetical protein n=1 Tax=Streptomyces sp. NPDC051643 TaxID=3365665 RepID=UPI0037B066CF